MPQAVEGTPEEAGPKNTLKAPADNIPKPQKLTLGRTAVGFSRPVGQRTPRAIPKLHHAPCPLGSGLGCARCWVRICSNHKRKFVSHTARVRACLIRCHNDEPQGTGHTKAETHRRSFPGRLCHGLSAFPRASKSAQVKVRPWGVSPQTKLPEPRGDSSPSRARCMRCWKLCVPDSACFWTSGSLTV